MRLGLGAKVLLDRADIARPVEVDGGIGNVRHGEYFLGGVCHIGGVGEEKMEAALSTSPFFSPPRAASTGRVPFRWG